MWIPQLGYPVGLVILFIAFLDELAHVVAGNKPPLREAEADDRAEEVIERAIESGI